MTLIFADFVEILRKNFRMHFRKIFRILLKNEAVEAECRISSEGVKILLLTIRFQNSPASEAVQGASRVHL